MGVGAGRTVALCSFRLGGTDGVSIEAEKLVRAFQALGWRVVTVAGEGRADHIVAGLRMSAGAPMESLPAALAAADLVVVENLCSLPLNIGAARAVAAQLAGRAAILHHHDFPWERPAFASFDTPWPPDDRAWAHVCISDHGRDSLLQRGFAAERVHRIYSSFDPEPVRGDRERARSAVGASPEERIVLQPTRAIERKNVPAALALAEQLGATYWLLGEAEDGYGPVLERLVADASVRVLRGRHELGIADVYAACDLVVLPSTWEGFGNPSVEAGLHGRALVIGEYPVASELARFGFRWFGVGEIAAISAFLADPDPSIPAWNVAVVRRHFSSADLPTQLAQVLASMPALSATTGQP